jgi:hypothetical protein
VSENSEPIGEDIPAPKRKPGRPKGSQNRVSRDAKELLAAGAPAALHRLLKIAAGRTLYGSPGPGRKRTAEQPSIDQQIAAIRIVADRLLPVLKASEVSTDLTLTSDKPAYSDVDLAKVLVGILGGAIEPPPSKPPVPSAELSAGGKLQADTQPEPMLSGVAHATSAVPPEPAKPTPRDPSLPVFKPVVEPLDEESRVSLEYLRRKHRLEGR